MSVFATILGVLALTFLRRLERKDERLLDRKISLLFTGPAPSLSAMRSTLEERGLVVSTAEYERHVDEGRVEVTFHARVPAGAHEDLIELLEAQPGVRRVQVESLS